MKPVDESDCRLDDLIADYLESVEAGRPLDRSDLFREHPEFEGELRDFFTSYDQVDHLLAPLRSASTRCQSETPSDRARRQEPVAGDIIAGHELIEEIGRGGMGIVWKARHIGLNRLVALKTTLAASEAASLRRFRQEAEAVASLDHPNIVPIHEVGEDGGQPYFSMRLIEGGNLSAYINGRPQDAHHAAALVAAIARAVDHAHQRGVLHRDLKPANVLLDADSQPCVADFGLARRLESDSGLTPSGIALGTPSYMAPEQALPPGGTRRPQPTIAADVYSLGAILYEMLTGRPPFRAETPLQTLVELLHSEPARPRHVVPAIPIDLETICLKCIDKDPARRYATAALLADDLARFLAGEPVQARPMKGIARAWRVCRKHPVPAALSIALVVSLVVGFAVSAWQWSRAAANLQRANQEHERAEAQLREVEQGFDLAHEATVAFFNRFSEAPRLREVPELRSIRRELLQQSRAYFERFLARRADDPRLRAELAAMHFRIAAIDSEIGSKTDALAGYRRARALYEQVTAEHPTNLGFRTDLARATHRVAMLEDTVESAEAAVPTYLLARMRFEALCHEYPEDPELPMDLAAVLNNLGHVYVTLNRQDEALACFEEKVMLASGLAWQHPHDPAVALTLAKGWIALGQLHATQKHEAEAACCFVMARETLETQVNSGTAHVGVRRELASLDMQLGGELCAAGRYSDALPIVERAHNLSEKLAADDGNSIGSLSELSRSHRQYGHALRGLGRLEDAAAHYRSALTLAERVAARDPDTFAHGADVASAHFDMGTILDRQKNWDLAARTYAVAAKEWGALVRQAPRNASYQHSLGLSLKNVGATLWNSGKHDAGLAQLRAALTAFQSAFAMSKSNEHRRALAGSLDQLSQIECSRHCTAAALAMARDRQQLAQDEPEALYAAARTYARIAAVDIEKVAAIADVEAAKQAEGLAIATLRRAIDCGFKDGERLRTESAFRSLRNRVDFPRVPATPIAAQSRQ